MTRSLDHRILFIGVVALGIVSFDHQPRAHHPGLHAEETGAGQVEVDAVYVAGETCWKVAEIGPGTPAGLEAPAGAIPVVMTVERVGEICGQAITPVRASVVVPSLRGAKTVMVYVVDRDGTLVKTDRASIRR